MDNNGSHNPPVLIMAFFRWFCHPDLREEIEGDLLEQFQQRTNSVGLKRSKLLFIKDVFSLFRPQVIRSFRHLFFKNSVMPSKN